MTPEQIANQPAYPVPATYNPNDNTPNNYTEFGSTFFQECVALNVAAFATARPDQTDKDIVVRAINLATETCKQLAEKSNQ